MQRSAPMPISYHSYIPTLPHIMAAGHTLVFSQHIFTIIDYYAGVILLGHN
jgi:hypothetical protein